jgi:3-hydroxyacyl-CoA dehydrogenase
MKAEGLRASCLGNRNCCGNKSFYTVKDGATHFYNIPSKSQTKIQVKMILLSEQHSRKQKNMEQWWCYH